ncbi:MULTISPECIES: FkbM family methyltransferase [Aphanothece]|uniref:FkbM family methyltransferase n=1 Tax=Aphanothece TaxID=1121 RepID=UPI003985446B
MTWKPKKLYSQNFEDLYLWRLLRDRNTGFYIDAGAFHPQIDSVTKIFYDQGWNGINIEPLPDKVRLFQAERPRDINLQLAVSQSSGKADFHAYGGSGLGSLKHTSIKMSSEHAQQHSVIEVRVATLREVVDAYNPSKIDFLKIDVEGSELDALKGFFVDDLRPGLLPSIIVVEATEPNSRIESLARQESNNLLESEGYLRFFHDGLNDYFCRHHDFERFRDLCVPPNVFDGVPATPSAINALEEKLSEKNSKAKLNEEQLRIATNEIGLQLAKIKELQEDRERLEADMRGEQQRLLGEISSLELKVNELSLEVELYSARLAQTQDDLKSYYSEAMDARDLLKRQQDKLIWLRAQRQLAEDLISEYSTRLHHFQQTFGRIAGGNGFSP